MVRCPHLLKAIQETLWSSYNQGGRWKCGVYRKAGEQRQVRRDDSVQIRAAAFKAGDLFLPEVPAIASRYSSVPINGRTPSMRKWTRCCVLPS